ncbi:MAG: hypothetical protein AABY93_02135 [Bacteroidota bacterium]
MRTFLIPFLSILLAGTSTAQSTSTIIGARSAALGNASSVLSDEWSLLNNIGGLAKVQQTSTAFSFEAKPALPGSSRMAAVFSTPLKIGAVGIGVFKFGDELYSEQILTTGYSNQFGIASLGLKLNYIQYRAEGFGTKSTLSISVGGIVEISPQVSIGAYIQNLNQPKLTNDERVPARLAAGLSFKPTEQLLLITEIEKDLVFDPIIKAGMEYCIHKKIFARTGFNLNPEVAFFGIGFKGWRLKFDYAIQYNNYINFGHQASACYRIEKVRKSSEKNNE